MSSLRLFIVISPLLFMFCLIPNKSESSDCHPRAMNSRMNADMRTTAAKLNTYYSKYGSLPKPDSNGTLPQIFIESHLITQEGSNSIGTDTYKTHRVIKAWDSRDWFLYIFFLDYGFAALYGQFLE